MTKKKLNHRNRCRLDENANIKILEYYKQGYSVEEIAEAYNVSESTIYKRIKQAEEQIRYQEMSKGKAYENIDMGKVFALKRAGWTLGKIGEEFKMKAEEIAEIIRQWQQDTGKEQLWPEV